MICDTDHRWAHYVNYLAEYMFSALCRALAVDPFGAFVQYAKSIP
jgi:hypothetical protein